MITPELKQQLLATEPKYSRFDSYLGNPHVKRDGVEVGYTQEHLMEMTRCTNDPVHFCTSWFKVIHLDKGLVDFNLYPYQKNMVQHFEDNRFSIVLACRQSGKSVSSLAYLLWKAMMVPDTKIGILANKGSTSKEMLARITLMLENIPFFLQPGCKTLNKSHIHFSNNSEILAASTSSSSIRGFSMNLIYLDEFAFVQDAATFYTSTYPVISSGKNSQVIITSTANGIGNQFHKIWEGALQGTNEYKPFRVDWWDVPGRDQAWKDQTVANTSQLQFDQEFGNTFFGTGDTLIDGETLMSLRKADPLYRKGPMNVYEEAKEGHEYMLLADVAKGVGKDYSTFNIIDITEKPFRQVAVYRNNKISPLLFPDEIHKWAVAYNEAYVVVESNDAGQVVTNGLYHDLEYENLHVESVTKGKLGVYMDRKVKRLGCSGFKDVLESGGLEVVDEQTIIEISTFEARGQSFEASDGNHDDLVMNLVMFGYFVNTRFFSNMTDINLRQFLHEQKIKEIEDDVVPFGIINDGTDVIEQEIEIEDGWSLVQPHSDDDWDANDWDGRHISGW
jgi:hypothetical protein